MYGYRFTVGNDASVRVIAQPNSTIGCTGGNAQSTITLKGAFDGLIAAASGAFAISLSSILF